MAKFLFSAAMPLCIKTQSRRAFLVGLLITLIGCNATEVNKSPVIVEENQTENVSVNTSDKRQDDKINAPIRALKTEADSKKSTGLPQRIALMPFIAQPGMNDDITSMLRQSVFSHLSSTNYLFVRPQEVDQRILLLNDSTPFSNADAPILTELLEADALLIGKVLSSDVTYAGVAAQIYYKVEISLIDNKGKEIWSNVFSERSIEGGISVDPFTLLYNLAMTAMHVGKENMFAVADKIGRQVATSIPQPEGAFTLRNLFIESVVHDGSTKVLSYGETLKVGVKAPPNMMVSVSIESIPELFQAIETSPGSYFVDIPINTKWNGKNLLLTAYVVDKVGNRARKISHLGLLHFDNQAPAKVSDVYSDLSENTVSLRWQHSEAKLSYKIYQRVNNTTILLHETTKKHATIAQPHIPFNMYEMSIVAIDRAGNKSTSFDIDSIYLPSQALKQSQIINKAKLPSLISKDSRLTKQNSPYLVDGLVHVDKNAILFIEPGASLEFTQGGTLEINGSLSTFGQTPIIFKSISNSPQDQSFIRIDTTRHVELNGFTIDKAGIAIEIINGTPLLSDCVITNSNYSALSITNKAKVEVQNCLINGSNTSAIVVANNARLTIKNSEMMNNFPFHIQNSSTYVVDARNNKWLPAADAITILGNVEY